MNRQEVGRVAGILGAALTFFVGVVSVVLGTASSSPDQDGSSLIVRGSMLIGLSAVAGYGASLSYRKPGQATIHLVTVAVLGSAVAFRSFWLAATALVIAAFIIYSTREQ